MVQNVNFSYKDWQHIKRFVADKLVQTDMFIYCFDAFLERVSRTSPGRNSGKTPTAILHSGT